MREQPTRASRTVTAAVPALAAVVVAFGVGGVGAARAQSPAVRVPPDAPTTTLAGQVELARLVDTAAQRLHVNMEYDAASLKGQVTLRLEGGLSDDELWQLVNRVLAARGFTTVRQATSPGSPPSYSVVKLADAPAAAGMVLPAEGVGPPGPGAGGAEGAEGGAGGPLAGYRTVVVSARNRSARDLVDQIGRGLGGGRSAGPGAGNATALGDSGLIVISDLSPRVEPPAAGPLPGRVAGPLARVDAHAHRPRADHRRRGAVVIILVC